MPVWLHTKVCRVITSEGTRKSFWNRCIKCTEKIYCSGSLGTIVKSEISEGKKIDDIIVSLRKQAAHLTPPILCASSVNPISSGVCNRTRQFQMKRNEVELRRTSEEGEAEWRETVWKRGNSKEIRNHKQQGEGK